MSIVLTFLTFNLAVGHSRVSCSIWTYRARCDILLWPWGQWQASFHHEVWTKDGGTSVSCFWHHLHAGFHHILCLADNDWHAEASSWFLVSLFCGDIGKNTPFWRFHTWTQKFLDFVQCMPVSDVIVMHASAPVNARATYLEEQHLCWDLCRYLVRQAGLWYWIAADLETASACL